MVRLMWNALLLGLLALLMASNESSAQSMKKRAGPVIDLDGYRSQGFDYWTPLKDKLDKPILNKFSLPKGKDYKEDGEILVKELSEKEGAKEVFGELKKQMKPPSGQTLDNLTTEAEVKKDGPKITQMVIRNGTFTGEGAKDKEVKEARLFVAVIETKDKKYLVRMVGPRIMISIVQPDVETFLKDLKK